MKGNLGTFVLIFSKDSQLRIRRGPFQNYRSAVLHLPGAAESLGVGFGQIQNPVEHFADRHCTRPRHK